LSCRRHSLWRSFINRSAAPADAITVLAPALDGFSPTPEFREIAEAKALLAMLPL